MQALPDIVIRRAEAGDFDALWPALRDVFRAGETYAVDRNISREDTQAMWMQTPRATYVAERGGTLLGTYFIKTNQAGGGAHVCNCGYVVTGAARGQGIAGAMCAHSQIEAVALGYQAMQFNCVVSTNVGAIRLWQRLGYETVGLLPRAFDHPREGLIDAQVMYKWLAGP